jgi:hypothetical protein
MPSKYRAQPKSKLHFEQPPNNMRDIGNFLAQPARLRGFGLTCMNRTTILQTDLLSIFG